jgi:hypothetical protein
MRRNRGLVVLAGLMLGVLSGGLVQAQERRIHRLMEELREEMWQYRQGLDFFARAPEYNTLVELRWRLRNSARQMSELESRPRAERERRETARQMDQLSNELKRVTGRLENRTDFGAPAEVRRRADRLKAHADRIAATIDRLRALVR